MSVLFSSASRAMAVLLLCALFLNLLPWGVLGRSLLPDFVLLALLYGVLYFPAHIGLWVTFGISLLQDVINDAQTGGRLGQHAIAYCSTVFVLIFFRRGLSLYPWAQQMALVGGLLLFARLLILAVRYLIEPSLSLSGFYFVGGLTGMLLWLPMQILLPLWLPGTGAHTGHDTQRR